MKINTILLILTWDEKVGVAIILSIITLILNVLTYYKTRKETRHNQGITLISTIRQFNGDLRKWADEVVGQMSLAVFICDLDPNKDEKTFYEKRHQLRINLSSLLDRGRFFLPNINKELYGQHKLDVNRGLKPVALECIDSCLKYVEKLDYKVQKPNLDLRIKIVETKKNFVGHLADELEPEKFERDLKTELIKLNNVFNKRK